MFFTAEKKLDAEYTSHLLESVVGQLEQKIKASHSLEEMIKGIEKQVIGLKKNVENAQREIQEHAEALLSLMTHDEEEGEGGDHDESSSEASGFDMS